MENKQIPKEENQIKSSNVQPNIDFENKMLSKIFCPLCFQVPKYSIKFTSSSNFVLVHECLEGKIIESSIVLEKIVSLFVLDVNIAYVESVQKNILGFQNLKTY